VGAEKHDKPPQNLAKLRRTPVLLNSPLYSLFPHFQPPFSINPPRPPHPSPRVLREFCRHKKTRRNWRVVGLSFTYISPFRRSHRSSSRALQLLFLRGLAENSPPIFGALEIARTTPLKETKNPTIPNGIVWLISPVRSRMRPRPTSEIPSRARFF